MMAMGGGVRGGIYGTAASLDPDATNPSIQNQGRDVKYETDFRAVYAKVLDSWLGVLATCPSTRTIRASASGLSVSAD